jgi:glycosyltransferase involved in cell wall biosynthesis
MHITVCICTRNRGASIVGTLGSVASCAHGDFDVVVVDQSETDETERAVRAAMDAGCLTYIHSRTKGAAVARNAALANACGEVVAFTDDDCIVPPEWLGRIAWYFQHCPSVEQLCGEVRAAPHLSTDGFIPAYSVRTRKRIASPWLKWREGGIGANLAFRRAALDAAGPFDELLGPGGELFNCEDGDMTYRVLRAGYSVLNVPDVYVIHNGMRTWQDGQVLLRRTGFAVGAAYMKHARLGDIAILPTLLIEWSRTISWGRLLRLQRHSGLARFLWYALGMCASFRYPIDRRRRVYLPRRS